MLSTKLCEALVGHAKFFGKDPRRSCPNCFAARSESGESFSRLIFDRHATHLARSTEEWSDRVLLHRAPASISEQTSFSENGKLQFVESRLLGNLLGFHCMSPRITDESKPPM